MCTGQVEIIKSMKRLFLFYGCSKGFAKFCLLLIFLGGNLTVFGLAWFHCMNKQPKMTEPVQNIVVVKELIIIHEFPCGTQLSNSLFLSSVIQ